MFYFNLNRFMTKFIRNANRETFEFETFESLIVDKKGILHQLKY